MVPTGATNGSPTEQLLTLIGRTLWALYAAFWISILICTAIAVAIHFIGGPAPVGALGTIGTQPDHWGDWQFLFLAAGLVCVYLMHRLGGILLRPERLWRGARNLEELADRLQRERGTDPEIEVGAPTTEMRRRSLSHAVQHLLGKVVVAYLVLWIIAEIPVILGVVDQLVSGSPRFFLGLLFMSAVSLLIRRPSRKQISRLLAPLLAPAGTP